MYLLRPFHRARRHDSYNMFKVQWSTLPVINYFPALQWQQIDLLKVLSKFNGSYSNAMLNMCKYLQDNDILYPKFRAT